jgi:tetratricopeptide (TPR) repeat protein
MMRGFANIVVGRLDEARADLDRSIELCASSGDLESAGWAHMNHALLAYFSGVTDGVEEHVLRSVEIADVIGSAFSRIWARYNLGLLHVLHERWVEADAAYAEGLELIGRHRTGREGEPWILAMRAISLLGLGDAHAALAAARRALELSQSRGVVNVRPAARCSVARALIAAHGTAGVRQAREELQTALRETERFGTHSSRPLVMVDLAGLAELTGDAGAAARWRAEARVLFERAGATGHVAALDGQRWESATTG